MVDLVKVKSYLRIDDEFDNDLLASFLLAAKEYLANAGILEMQDNLYDIACMMLIAHWYENRSAVAIGTVTKEIEFSLRGIIMQLKYKV